MDFALYLSSMSVSNSKFSALLHAEFDGLDFFIFYFLKNQTQNQEAEI